MADSDQMYVAGEFVPMTEARVSALDAGLLLGAGLFETLRTYGGRPFRLAAHLARLRASGTVLRIFVKETDEAVAEVIDRLVCANGAPDARVRLTATRGSLTDELDDDEAPAATLLATAGPMTPYPAEFYEQGVTVVVSDIRANETDPSTYHKTTGYMTNLLALRDAHRARAAEAIRFNTKNRLAEGAISNIFLVRDGRLLTPPVEEGLLAGITRAAVLEVAAETGVPAQQQALAVQDLLAADEVFLTNAIMEVMPVARFEQHEVGTGLPGPVTRQLAEAYRALVARETGG
ncbi:MAG TPA: aminotransferase class IV, partial [Phycisphaerae bacterium]|nr:aminotransferase class IV [Phycisphaerae bacterium]